MTDALKYMKKPVEIEAFQMTKERQTDMSEWPAWLKEASEKDRYEIGSFFYRRNRTMLNDILHLRVPGGELIALASDDWIIRGRNGVLYACRASEFANAYDRLGVEDPLTIKDMQLILDALQSVQEVFADIAVDRLRFSLNQLETKIKKISERIKGANQ